MFRLSIGTNHLSSSFIIKTTLTSLDEFKRTPLKDKITDLQLFDAHTYSFLFITCSFFKMKDNKEGIGNANELVWFNVHDVLCVTSIVLDLFSRLSVAWRISSKMY